METKELIFKFEKETKNTVRYQEQVAPDSSVVIGPLYIQKSALEPGNPPQEISVTVGITVEQQS